MSNPTGVSRRMDQCFNHLFCADYEGALINLFPAIDRTAKKRRPREDVGTRIKNFLRDEERTISLLGTGIMMSNYSVVGGLDLPGIIYKIGRTSMMHEGELDPRLTFDDSKPIIIGNNSNLPTRFITALCLAVIMAPENEHELVERSVSITVLGHRFLVNELWGGRRKVEDILRQHFPYFDFASQSGKNLA